MDMEKNMENMDMANTANDYINLCILCVDFFKGIRKFWFLIVLLMIFGAAGLFGFKKVTYVPIYASEATFTVKTTGNGVKNEINTVYGFYYDKNTAEHIGATFPYILGSDLFKFHLKEELNTDYINGSISASVIKDSNMVTLRVTSTNKEDSLKVLNGVIRVYPEIAQYVIGNNEFETINQPETKTSPVNIPNYKKELVKGALGGLAMGLVIAFFYALTRKTIRTEDDLKKVINRQCLGLVPEIKNTAIITNIKERDAHFQENIYSLQNRVDFLMKKNNQKVLLVTSTVPSEGKTTIALNLALATAQRGLKVLLIEGDLRKPELNTRLNIKETENAMHDVLKGTVELKNAVQYLEKENLYYLSCGQRLRNSVSLIQSKKMENLVMQAREFADMVIIDSPPCGMMADAGGYYEYVDGVLMIVRQDWVNESKVMDAVLDLPERGNKLIGCVLNRVKTGLTSYGYGYSSYGYGYGKYNYYQGNYYGAGNSYHSSEKKRKKVKNED